MNYQVIKEFPGSPKVGTVIQSLSELNPEAYPEFFQIVPEPEEETIFIPAKLISMENDNLLVKLKSGKVVTIEKSSTISKEDLVSEILDSLREEYRIIPKKKSKVKSYESIVDLFELLLELDKNPELFEEYLKSLQKS